MRGGWGTPPVKIMIPHPLVPVVGLWVCAWVCGFLGFPPWLIAMVVLIMAPSGNLCPDDVGYPFQTEMGIPQDERPALWCPTCYRE